MKLSAPEIFKVLVIASLELRHQKRQNWWIRSFATDIVEHERKTVHPAFPIAVDRSLNPVLRRERKIYTHTECAMTGSYAAVAASPELRDFTVTDVIGEVAGFFFPGTTEVFFITLPPPLKVDYKSNAVEDVKPEGSTDDSKETVSSRASRQSWVRLIQKVYEVDPLVCSKCGHEMRVIAIITDLYGVNKILDCLKKNNAPPF